VVSLAWLRAREGTIVPILGARRVEHLDNNLAALELTLTTDHLQALINCQPRAMPVGPRPAGQWGTGFRLPGGSVAKISTAVARVGVEPTAGDGLVGLTEVERDADGLVTDITSVYDPRHVEPDRKAALIASTFAP
jgi:Aldo/keto reductase family